MSEAARIAQSLQYAGVLTGTGQGGGLSAPNAFFGQGQLVNHDTPATAVNGLSCAPADQDGKPLDPAIAAPGAYAINCSGTSTNYGLSLVPGQLTISQAQTTTSLTTTTSSSGELTITASVVPTINPVDGAAAPSGNVDFQLDGRAPTAVVATLGNEGTASITIAKLAPGHHQLTATYPGDADYSGSTTKQSLTVACKGGRSRSRVGTTCRLVDDHLALVDVPKTLTVVAPAGAPGVVVDYAPPTAQDTDGDTTATVSCDPAPNALFLVGKTRVTCTANDADDTHKPLSAAFDVIVQAPMQVTSGTLPTARVGVPFSGRLTATGGAGKDTWRVVSGSLPGLTVHRDGSITGTPTKSGTFSAVVSVNDQVMTTITLTVDRAATTTPGSGGTATGSSGTSPGTGGTSSGTGGPSTG